VSTTSKQIFGR